MTPHTPAAGELSVNEIPVDWRQEARLQLQPEENVQAALEVDLDTQLRFVRGLVLVTDRRLLSRAPGASGWTSWDYRPGLTLQHQDKIRAYEAQRIAARLNAASGGSAADTVSFCNTGHWAATNCFALSEVAGQKQVKLYAGSMVEWTKDGSESLMANVPGRLQQLAINAKLWADRTLK